MARVLLVDDEEDLLVVAKKFLELDDPTLDVVTTTSPQEAFRLLEEESLDAVVSDYLMPEMDGLELLRKLRDEGNSIPVIMFTGQGREEVAIQALNLGADYYLMKDGTTKSLFAELAHIIRQMVQHKRIGEALRESEERYRRLTELLFDGIAIHEAGTLQDINPAGAQMLGYDCDELIGRSFFEVIQQESFEIARQSMDKELDTPFEIVGRRKNGMLVHLEAVAGNCTYHGRAARMAAFRDITERKQTELALQQSEQRLDLALKGGNIGLWDRDIRTGKVVRNERTAQIYGYSLEEMEAKVDWWESRIHPEDKLAILEKRNRHLKGLTPLYEAEYRLRHKLGEWRWIMSRGKVVERDEDGNALRITGTLLDITERKKAEEDYRNLFEIAPIGIGIATPEGTVLKANQTMQQLLGYSKHELHTLNLRSIYVDPSAR
ncbi:MAG: PAS domain S-box protein, partial [Candidatus Hodarchaeales archaeon]